MRDYKSILIVAYHFPPENTGGSQRPYRIAQNLHKYGYRPVVISRSLDTGKKELSKKEHKFFVEYRIPTRCPRFVYNLKSKYYFNIYDPEFYIWKTALYRYLDNIILENEIEIVFISMPPFSMSKIGFFLKKKFGIKLVFDWRDHWSQWNTTPYATYLHYVLNLKLEKKCLRLADLNIVATPQMKKDLGVLHRTIPKDKIAVVTNSFEAQESKLTSNGNDSKFIIGYVGSFYFNPKSDFLMKANWSKKLPYQWLQYLPFIEDWKYRSPYYFFKIIEEFLSQYPEYRSSIELIFAGKKENWFSGMVKYFNLDDVVKHIGFISHSESISFQKSCDALLLTSSKIENGKSYTIAGKTFEYFSLKKPIIAVVPEGDQKEIIQKTGSGYILDPDNLEYSVSVLYEAICSGFRIDPDKDEILKYEVGSTLKALTSEIEKVL